MKKSKIFFFALFLLLALGFTGAVKLYDVDAIGPADTSVGFSHINAKFADMVGYNENYYNIADKLGYVVILIFLVFAFIGLVQMIKRRSLFKVDGNILALGGIYFGVFALYVLFEKLAIDYRPVIIDGGTTPEASFPSSHTMMAIVVLVGAIMQLKYYIDKKSVRLILMVIMIALMLAVVATRTLSGAHWLTDIVAGILYSLALIFAYAMVESIFDIDENGAVEMGYKPKH